MSEQPKRDRVFDLTGCMGHKHPSPVLRVTPEGRAAVQMAVPVRDGHPLGADDGMIVKAENGYYVEPVGRSPSPAAAGARSGPAQVATPAYRSNYETIFGARPARGQA